MVLECRKIDPRVISVHILFFGSGKCLYWAIPVIPLSVPDLSGREVEYLRECINSTYVSSIGPFVTRFEALVASATGAEAAAATSSGTAGLHVALIAAGVERDDLVIVPTYTFVASANSIVHAGAVPWLFDIDPISWTLDPVLLAEQLEAETRRKGGALFHIPTGRRVTAIMPVHTLGIPADMDPIVTTARSFGLAVVADAAAALGARYKEHPIGIAGADISVFSFNGNKTVTAGGGGAVAGPRLLVDKVRHLSTTARRGPGYDHDAIGFNYRMTNVEAAIGCAQIERLDRLLQAKRRIARCYRESLSDLPGIEFFPVPPWAQSACWLSGVVTPDARAAEELRTCLIEAEVDARPFWKPMHLQAPFRHAPATRVSIADDLWARIVPLPCSPGLTNAEQARIIDYVRAAWPLKRSPLLWAN